VEFEDGSCRYPHHESATEAWDLEGINLTGGSHCEATAHTPGQEAMSLTTRTRALVGEERLLFPRAHEMRSGPAGPRVIVPEKTVSGGLSWAGARLREMGRGWKFGPYVSWFSFSFSLFNISFQLMLKFNLKLKPTSTFLF
jgi:hypothetical protein